MAAEQLSQVGVRLVATLDKYAVPETPLAVPANLNRLGLSEVVNQLLSLEKRVPFDFSIQGQLLRSSLAKHLESHSVSAVRARRGNWFPHTAFPSPCHARTLPCTASATQESIVEIKYFPALQAPELAADEEVPDWVSGVAVAGSCVPPAAVVLKQVLTPHLLPVHSIPISSCYDGTLRLHDPSTGAVQQEVLLAPDSLTCVAASEGSAIAAGAADGSLHMLNMDGTAAPAHVLSMRAVEAVQSVAFVGAGAAQVLAAGTWSGIVHAWHTAALVEEAGAAAAPAPKRRAGKRSKAPAPSALPAVSDISPTLELLGHKGAVTCMATLPAAPAALVTGSWDHSLRVWDLAAGGVEVDSHSCNKVVSALASAPASAPGAGYLLATGHPDHLVRLWDSRAPSGARRMSDGGRPRALATAHTAWVSCIAWQPGSDHLFASAGHDGSVRVWDLRADKPIFALKSHAELQQGEYQPTASAVTPEAAADTRPPADAAPSKVLSLAWAPDGSGLWSGGSDAHLQLHAFPA